MKDVKLPYDLVRVVWTDASTDVGWEDPPEAKKGPSAPHVVSVGFLVMVSEDAMLLASTVSSQGETNNRLIIPRGMVVSTTILKKKTLAKPIPK